jgi:hypothetical protein
VRAQLSGPYTSTGAMELAPGFSLQVSGFKHILRSTAVAV